MTFVGDFDIAQMVLYAFWIFFFGLVIYLQRETMREGYPMESEVTGKPGMFGPFPLPEPKTFSLPHGRGTLTVPDLKRDGREITERKLAMKPTAPWSGSPFEPTGDPLVDGIGPAAWAERRDEPDLDFEGHPRLAPMSAIEGWSVAAGDQDIRGWPVIGCDGRKAGTCVDLWIDKGESLLRYIEVDLGGRRVLAPMFGVQVRVQGGKRLEVDSIRADQFANVPVLRTPGQITSLEEEKIMAYYAGGKLYATRDRQEPWL